LRDALAASAAWSRNFRSACRRSPGTSRAATV
jgi:hypothetical protein